VAVFADEEFVVEYKAVLVLVQEKLGVTKFTDFFCDGLFLQISSSKNIG
jgi:hypothetical protein